MEIATNNFKKYLLDAYRDLPDDIEIINDGEYHILKDNKNGSFLLYIYEDMYQEYSYTCLGDIVWSTIFHKEEEAA